MCWLLSSDLLHIFTHMFKPHIGPHKHIQLLCSKEKENTYIAKHIHSKHIHSKSKVNRRVKLYLNKDPYPYNKVRAEHWWHQTTWLASKIWLIVLLHESLWCAISYLKHHQTMNPYDVALAMTCLPMQPLPPGSHGNDYSFNSQIL